mmetsp:Transcript_27432/g.64069  ORF Transcript_27432/g.64069 Transcript_27432/m.64069 type:complete len:478 (-) Transcript_27432:46-1479(-)
MAAFPDRVNLVFGNTFALARVSDEKPLAGVEVGLLKENKNWKRANYRWILQRIPGTSNTFLIRNDNHPNKALVATDPVLLQKKNAEVVLQRFLLETVKGSPDQEEEYYFHIKTTGGKYVVIAEALDRSGQRVVSLTPKPPAKPWRYSNAVKKSSSIFTPQGALGAVAGLTEKAAGSAGSAARSVGSTMNSTLDSTAKSASHAKGKIGQALKAPMRLMKRHDTDGGEPGSDAEDFGMHLTLFKGDAAAAFAALAAKDTANLSQVIPPLSAVMAEKMELGTVPISDKNSEANIDDIFNVLYAQSSHFVNDYQGLQGCSDIVWSAPQVPPEAPFGGLGTLKCRLSVPVLGKKPFAETLRIAMCMEGGQKTLVCQSHGVIDGGMIVGQISNDTVYYFKEAEGEGVLTMSVVIKTPDGRAQQQAIDGAKKAMENFRLSALKHLNNYHCGDSGKTGASRSRSRLLQAPSWLGCFSWLPCIAAR